MSWVRILLIGLGLLLAAGGTAYYAYASARTTAARDWPSAPGRVTESRVEVETRTTHSNNITRRKTEYRPRVEYGYEANGRPLRNHRIWLTTSTHFSTREAADRFIAAYPPGAAVAVFYNPLDPADSALIVESTLWPIFILVGVGLVLIAFGWFRMGRG